MINELQRLRESPFKLFILLLLILALGGVFMLQQVDWLAHICKCQFDTHTHFAFNKAFRLILNDVLMLGVISAWFNTRSITRLALYIQLLDFFILLPIYLVVKLIVEGDEEISSPLLSHLHRLIVNPTLMILLIPAIYFQRYQYRK